MDRRTFARLALLGPLVGCATREGVPAVAVKDEPIGLRIDTAGAEALLAVLERSSVDDAAIDRLLTIRGVQAMVDNTTKYLPEDTRERFRAAVHEFVATRKSTIGHFGLASVVEHAGEIRRVIAGLRGDPGLADEVARPVNAYRPASGPLAVTVYCVAGGVSHGFVPDDERTPAFYMAIDRAMGDLGGVRLNMTHELYHVAQRAARARVPGLDARVFDLASAPVPVHMLTVVLEEGTATFVADPAGIPGSGPYLEMWRAGYTKNATPATIAANFALFDRLLDELRRGATTWDAAYKLGFSDIGPPMYFVGHEVARALVARYGPGRLGSYFQGHPAVFFADYTALARAEPAAVRARFAPATEAWILASI